MATVKIPGIGPVDKKWVYVAGAATVGIVGYAYWNKSRADAAETEVADFTEGTGYAIDSGVDEYVNPGGSQAPVEQDFNPAPSNNLEWGQAAIEFLSDQGFEGGAIAVGLYMTRQDLSSVQANMIRAVHGAIGPPPVGSFPITVTPNTPTPNPEPDPDPSDFPKMTAPTGLSAHDISRNTVGFLWNAVSGARYYTLSISGKGSFNTASTHYSAVGLKPNTRYSAKVRAYDMDKQPGPWSASRTFRTKK